MEKLSRWLSPDQFLWTFCLNGDEIVRKKLVRWPLGITWATSFFFIFSRANSIPLKSSWCLDIYFKQYFPVIERTILTRPWNVDIEALSNLKLKLSLIKSSPVNAAYQLYLHLRNDGGFNFEGLCSFPPVIHHWVGRILPLQPWFSSQLPYPYPGQLK